ncbi:response regulator transcription factor [bacterium SCSIO 12741]|nr:response regulator transcription factor [bacterium SCSIO 12741]
MRALLVDDETLCRNDLSSLLKHNCPEITEIQVAESVDRAVEIWDDYCPEVLFLDIQMPQKNGFELLDAINLKDLFVIFVTAHEEYALRAIKAGPTGYLMKPVDHDELKETVSHTKELYDQRKHIRFEYQHALEHLIESVAQKKAPEKICLPHLNKLSMIEIRQIVLLSATSNYTTFHLEDGTSIVLAKTIRSFESVLGDDFIRIHRSYCVNLQHIKEFSHAGNELKMSNGKRLPVSRRRVSFLIQKMKGYSY